MSKRVRILLGSFKCELCPQPLCTLKPRRLRSLVMLRICRVCRTRRPRCQSKRKVIQTFLILLSLLRCTTCLIPSHNFRNERRQRRHILFLTIASLASPLPSILTPQQHNIPTRQKVPSRMIHHPLRPLARSLNTSIHQPQTPTLLHNRINLS